MNVNAISTPRGRSVGKRLSGRLISVSVSAADDLAQLGFPPNQLDRVLEVVLAPLVAEGCRIAYGGSINYPQSDFTLSMSERLAEAYCPLEQKPDTRPFVHFLTLNAFVQAEVAVLVAHLRKLAPYGEAWVYSGTERLGVFTGISQKTDEIAMVAPGQDQEPQFRTGAELEDAPLYREIISRARPEPADALKQMRQAMAIDCDARVQMGGRTKGPFEGRIAGLCEEARLTVDHDKPLLPLGGFGGATRDIAAALGLFEPSECVPRKPTTEEDVPYEKGLEEVREVRDRFETTFGATEREALRILARTESACDAGELVGQFMLRRFAAAS